MLTTALGIAVAVAVLASLAGFIATTEATMTQQALSSGGVDWQIQLSPGMSPQAAITELTRAPGYTKLAQVGYADTPGLEATTGDTTQTTGPGQVLGVPPDYRTLFPGEIRLLIGHGEVLLAQQTAANLHATPGSSVTIKRPGLAPVAVTIDAIVDLPAADSLFQTFASSSANTPQAPPDNVLILPLSLWHAIFDPVTEIAPNAVRVQLHASLPHNLPSSPSAAFILVSRWAKNYEARLAGTAIIGNNLGTRLDLARSDALYARLLFLFLGVPGALLAALVTALLVASSAERRRRDHALLRLRGASTRQILQLALVEAVTIGLVGTSAGIVAALGVVRLNFGRWGFGNESRTSLIWGALAALSGMTIAILTVLVPAWRDARRGHVTDARRSVRREASPWWERSGLDVGLLTVAAFVYWQLKRSGYQIVLAPEGIPHVSVAYSSLLAPLFLWAGSALLIMRFSRLLLRNRGGIAIPVLRLLSGHFALIIAASLSRQRKRLATGLVLVALALAYAASTAIFNATYERQSLLDAELSNGADVTISGGPGVDLGRYETAIAQVPGVQAVVPMLHRFAYVGADLQDLYGIDPTNLQRATRLANSFFVGMTANQALHLLTQIPDGIFVSPETVSDFQLMPGDMLKLRLQGASDHQYHVVSFRYVGIAREFPTAPSDSFLVANADYVARQTGSPAPETLLVKTNQSPSAVAAAVRDLLGGTSGATVRDIAEAQTLSRSSLTAVSLRGLSRLQLAFAVALATSGAALVLALGLAERQRSLAIITALGATPRQLSIFVWGETGLMLVGGLLAGGMLGWAIAHVLVTLLTQIFDPPPSDLAVPLIYLVFVSGATAVAVAIAGQIIVLLSRRGFLETLRRL
ncbi:MAG: ABC transporter permease [Chloroflexota bacterium]